MRVAGLKQQIESGVTERSLDGLTPAETLRAVARAHPAHGARPISSAGAKNWRRRWPKHGIRFLDLAELAPADLKWLENFYRSQVRPVLTPLAIDPAHPFPQLLNKSLNIIVQVEMKTGGEPCAIWPSCRPRACCRPWSGCRADGRADYVFLGRVVGHFLRDLFPGTKILGYWHFRVTRNSELYIDEQDTGNLLKAVENGIAQPPQRATPCGWRSTTIARPRSARRCWDLAADRGRPAT